MNASLLESLPAIYAGDRRSSTAFILHGGGGPQTIMPIVKHLEATMHAIAPTHPGWQGTTRPAPITSVADLASAYLAWLLDHEERDVVVIGSSIGGWIALEMAVQASQEPQYAGLIRAVINIDGVGASVEGQPIADFFALDARGLAEVAWHNPERGYVDPATYTNEQRAIQQANRRTMATIAGPAMSDPTLVNRLTRICVPTLLIWGESDRVVTPAYGQAIAAAVSGAQFVEIPEAGHLPHLEAPDATWAAIDSFLAQA